MKKLFLLPFVAMFGLVGCGGGETPAGPTGGHAGTEADPFTTAEAIAKMDAAGSGVIVDGNVEYFVKGVVQSGSTVNTSYHQWYCMLDAAVGGKQFKISGATLPAGSTITEADGGLDGKLVVVKGYMELYNGEYKIGYLPASASPTGAKYIPSIVSIVEPN